MAKIYRGIISGHVRIVQVEYDGEVKMLCHRERHSPDGFAWGYGGSGPADLARSILWDHLGEEPTAPMYQAFKFDLIARLPGNIGFTITEDEVRNWIRWRPEELTSWRP